jgi:glycosyltransferase involved in cell wall biosynthesis
MNLVFLSPVQLYPPTSGAGRRVLSLAMQLSRAGCKTTVISFLTPLVPKLRPRVLQIDDNLSLVVAHFFSATVLKRLLDAHVIQFEYPYLLPYMILLKLLGRKFVLDEHGVEAYFIRELKGIPGDYRGSHSVGFILRRVPGLSPIVAAVEKLAVLLSSLVFACSGHDASEIQRLYSVDEDKVKVIPNCADPLMFEEVRPMKLGRPTVVFLGSFDHPPNVEAAAILVGRIAPYVLSRLREVIFLMIGRNPPPWLVGEKGGSIRFLGEVEDIRPLVAGADVVVAPIMSGSGTRQKIVEYMALGRPIVSTTKGAEGLELENGRDYLQRDDIGSFSQAVVELITDRDKAELLGRRARKVALEKYSWHIQWVAVMEAYRKVAEYKGPLMNSHG